MGFFLTQHWPNRLYHRLLQTKKPVKRLRKPSDHQLLSDRRKRSTTCLDDRFFVALAQRWYWHWKVWHLSVTFVLQTTLCHGVDWIGEQKFLFQKEEEVWTLQGIGSGNPGTLLGQINVDYRLTGSWYWNYFLVGVSPADSLNSLAEALIILLLLQ